MSVRFRYLAPDGREVEISTHDALVRAFMSGEIRDDTLLYDAEGGGWAPARSHSILMDLDLPGAAFTLTDAEPLTAEEVVAELAKERDALSALSSPPALRPLARTEERRPSSPREGTGVAPRDDSPRRPAPPPPAATASAPRPEAGDGGYRRSGEGSGLPLRTGQRRRSVAALGVVTTAFAAVAGALTLALLLGEPTTTPAEAAPLPASDPLPADGPRATSASGAGLGSAVSAAEASALQDLVTEMERLQVARGVDRVPSDWLEGLYLAEASRYPEVAAYWQHFAAYVEEMRAAESPLFHRVLLLRLQAHDLSEAQISMRLSRGIRSFEVDRPRREAVYASLTALSGAAQALHALLVSREDEISYEPAARGLSREPVTEAVPESAELRQELNRRLDDVLLAIEQLNGSRVAPRDELPLALRRGILAGAGTNMR
jgi:hypothetical protein